MTSALSTLKSLLERAKARYAAMTPEERKEMHQAQRESWIRAFTTPCEHGDLDWETCPHCRSAALSRNDGKEGRG